MSLPIGSDSLHGIRSASTARNSRGLSAARKINMKILVYGINYAPDMIGVAKYTTEMCQHLCAAGHDVAVVTSPPYYPEWKIAAPYKGYRYASETIEGISVVRCPLYVPRSPTGQRRLLHHLSFAVSSAPAVFFTALRFRPDVVLAIAPSIFGAPGAAAAGMVVGASRWIHLQDLEVDAAFELGFLSGSRFRSAALALERWVLRLFHRVSSISPKMLECLHAKGVPTTRLAEFRNWVDTEVIYPLDGPTRLRTALGIPPNVTLALYSGNMGQKQGVEYLGAAAQRLAQQRSDIAFLFCGTGSMKERLRDMTRDLPNVTLLDLQPAHMMNELLSTADIHLLPQMAGVMDLALPSKLPAMLASARPVIAMAKENTQLHGELDGAGIVIAPGDIDALVAAVIELANDPDLRRSMGSKGREIAATRWDRTVLLKELEATLSNLDHCGAAHAPGAVVSSEMESIVGKAISRAPVSRRAV
jgi:colanic acid biosynthesis glycosyl transferase WcaI